MQEKHQLLASHKPPTWNLACNPGKCPDQKSSQQPFDVWDNAQSTEPHQLGRHTGFIKILMLFKGHHSDNLKLLQSPLTNVFVHVLDPSGSEPWLHIGITWRVFGTYYCSSSIPRDSDLGQILVDLGWGPYHYHLKVLPMILTGSQG